MPREKRKLSFKLTCRVEGNPDESVVNLVELLWDPQMISELADMYGPEGAAESLATGMMSAIRMRILPETAMQLLAGLGLMGEDKSEEPSVTDKAAKEVSRRLVEG
jgi:hypothetical protein